jgi:hypothetical protein
MRYPGFLGGSNTNRTVNVDAERTVNFYPEIVTTGTPKSKIVLHGTPGHTPFVICGTGPIRAVWSEDGRMFAISGNRLFEIFQSQTVLNRGPVNNDGLMASISSNGIGGHQLFITSGGFGYIYDLTANTLTQILDPDFLLPTRWGVFVDSYFVSLSLDKFQISNLLNGVAWDALDVAQVSLSSDTKIAMATNHREIWLFGTKRIESWGNTGNNLFPFQPIGGAPIDHGIAAPFSAAVMDNTIFWLGADATGGGIVWKAGGYTPLRVSTHAVETMLNRLPRFDNAVAWVYSQEGHLFYVLYLPEADTTWVYDVSSNLWHERALWNRTKMRWEPHIGIAHTYCWGFNLVGDRQSGTIYTMSLDKYCDQLVGPQPFIDPDENSPSVSPSASRSPSASPSPSGGWSSSRSPSSSASPSLGDDVPDLMDFGNQYDQPGNQWVRGRFCPVRLTGVNVPCPIYITLDLDPLHPTTNGRYRILDAAGISYGPWGYEGDPPRTIVAGEGVDVEVFTNGSQSQPATLYIFIGSSGPMGYTATTMFP